MHTLPVVRMIKLRKAKLTVHVPCTGDAKNCNLLDKHKGWVLLGRFTHTYIRNCIEMYSKGSRCDDVD